MKIDDVADVNVRMHVHPSGLCEPRTSTATPSLCPPPPLARAAAAPGGRRNAGRDDEDEDDRMIVKKSSAGEPCLPSVLGLVWGAYVSPW